MTSYTQPLSYTADGAGNLTNVQYWPADGNGLFIYGIYPANAATTYNATGVEFTVQSDQSSDDDYMASDLMTGAPAANPVARVSTPVPLTFTHLLTKVDINLTAGTGFTSADLATATVSILGLKPTTTFDVQSTTVGTPSGTATDIIAGTGVTTSAIIVPSQSVAAGTNFIKVSCAGGDYIYQMGTATTFGASSVYTYNLTVNKTGITLSTASITAWTTIGAVNGVAELQ